MNFYLACACFACGVISGSLYDTGRPGLAAVLLLAVAGAVGVVL